MAGIAFTDARVSTGFSLFAYSATSHLGNITIKLWYLNPVRGGV